MEEAVVNPFLLGLAYGTFVGIAIAWFRKLWKEDAIYEAIRAWKDSESLADCEACAVLDAMLGDEWKS